MSKQTIEIEQDEVDSNHPTVERLTVRGEKVWQTIKQLLQDASVRRVIVQRRDGSKLLDIPVYAGVAGIALLGPWSAIPLLGAILFEYSLLVERRRPTENAAAKPIKKAKKPVAAKPEPQEEEVVVVNAAAFKADDLTRINGIGPKVSVLLQEKGIKSYAQLVDTPAATLKQLLEEAGPRYRLIDPTDWAAQAKTLLQGN